MIDQELFLELTESYLKSLVSDVSNSFGADFDSFTPFGELGINSFYILKIVKKLEEDFGTLPKTLLFENFNINNLADYFINKHNKTLFAKFEKQLQYPGALVNGVERKIYPLETISETILNSTSSEAVGNRTDIALQNVPIRILEKEAYSHPELGYLVKEIFQCHKNESSISRGTRNIAPNLFIGGEKRGYFNYSRSKNIILVYAYTGPDDYFYPLAKEMYEYCAGKNFELNILADAQIESVGEIPFSATPFGVIQRVLNIQDFTLQGSKMRRLRYLVSKFEKTGECRTKEYYCGSNPETDQNIATIIDKWCDARAMVNPLVYTVREEILAGTFSSEHRIFLTCIDDVLQNVIIISPTCAKQKGYLMDLEFYPRDMPLGGLEFAIVNIMEILVAEGCTMLSLGATLGPKLAPSSNADLEVDKILDGLREQNIFNDEGNLQFKNKFRPENKTIFLCRPIEGANADNVIDIIMMVADPSKMQTSDEENHNASKAPARVETPAETTAKRESNLTFEQANPGEAGLEAEKPELVIEGGNRAIILADFAYNPLNIPHKQIEFDLKTDSWAQLKTPWIEKQMRYLHGQLQQPASIDESLRGVFPFSYFVLASSGRTAEHIFFKAWPKKGAVLQNLLFPTTIFHQIDKGFTPVEVPHPELFKLDSEGLYKGNLNWEALQEYVESNSGSIAFVCIEVNNNAAGGCPVSMQQLKKVKALLSKYSIPLVIDSTRILENAQFLIEQEKEYAGKSIWQVVTEILSCADAVIGSLAKDFCVNKGGVIATNNASLFHKLQDIIHEEGGGLDVIDKKVIALSLKNKKQIETQVLRRMESARLIWKALKKHGIPVVQPAGGHCILIDVKQIREFNDFEYPVASFLAWMYLNTGIRAGAHSVGMQKHSPMNDLVRLAIPVGLGREQVEVLIERLIVLFKRKENIAEILAEGKASGTMGDVYTNYKLIKYHNVSGTTIAKASASLPAPENNPVFKEPYIPDSTPNVEKTPGLSETRDLKEMGELPEAGKKAVQSKDIAIVGIAGRYPKAKNMDEMWENLIRGRDCIGDIPDSRLKMRWHHGEAEKYRGGFIDDVDKFDALFFNISPREAEMLDPQERLFLEVAWEAIEDAGYYPETLTRENAPRNIGVFVGAVWAMYQMIGVEERFAGNKTVPNSFFWSIANRVSYWMNLSGPSLTLDTACSSSLTAIYLACEAIYKGECSAAIIGGVNLDLHRSKLDINTAGGTQSEDGVCRSFGQGANGYVAGEGVGAILIKPLEQAIQDKDHIYGVIKSIVVNHGGRTSGYSVPNPKAQARLISAALEKAEIDARTIGYIEAHGTGTELGDPIEITGLTDAFQAYKVKNQTCAIGSIKSNIGHLEAAAGVVGVCKVLLQMKHRKLVPSLHSSKLNEHVDFENSPFYVEQEVEEWKGKTVDGIQYPLRAGVSSFGAGGSNAHIIIDSFDANEPETAAPCEQLFPLSARNEEQLRDTAIRLRNHIQRDLSGETSGLQLNINDIAYTLQAGRKSFDYRLIIIAKTKEELVDRLGRFIAGQKEDNILAGNVKNTEGITRLLNRNEKEEFIKLLSQRRNLHKLSQLWLEGLLSDWHGFQGQAVGRRISLPTYPFADKRHWAALPPKAKSLALLPQSGMHPLIDTNESTFQRQLFKKTFSENEFFIYDHVVSEIPTLPGVAYLELARKAGEIAAGRKVRKIKNIVWVSPLTVQNSVPTETFVDLKPNGDVVQFEVYSEAENGRKQLYSQGKLAYATRGQAEAEPEFVDIESIRARCSKVIDGEAAYPLFKSLGLDLGPSFQVIQEVYKSGTEILGALKIPEIRNGDFHQFVLHPSLVDGSFQAGMGAALGAALTGDEKGEMFVPYSIGEVEILHPLEPECYSYVTESKKEDNKRNAKLVRSNVLILGKDGKILVKIRESVGVPLTDVHEKPVQNADADKFAKLYYSHVWEKAPLSVEVIEQNSLDSILLFEADSNLRDHYQDRLNRAGYGSHHVILVQPGESFQALEKLTYRINPKNAKDYIRLFESLNREKHRIGKICFAWPLSLSQNGENEGTSHNNSLLEKHLAQGVYAFLFLCQSLLEQKQEGRIQLLYLYTEKTGEPQPHNEAINGFIKTLQLEHARLFSAKTLEIQGETTTISEILDIVLAELHPDAREETTVRYKEKERYVRKLKECSLEGIQASDPASQHRVLKENGVYLITGGAGGLGLIFAEYLARECKARLVLTGRSELSEERKARLDELGKLGAQVLYLPADVANYAEVEHLLKETSNRFGGINGIIHSAGVLRDSYLRNKTSEDMRAVFAPKVYGTLHLDEATKGENLDFFVMFSSMSAVVGNMGQCDYAFANHFMDSFAARRERLQAKGERSGKTLSLNWSIWADGGMQLDEQTEIFFKKNLGIKPLSIETGVEAFSKGISSTKPQFAVVEGVQDKLELAWGLRKEEPQALASSASESSAPPESAGASVSSSSTVSKSQAAGGEIITQIQNALSDLVMNFLKLDADDMALDKILLDLGFDSIGLATFANSINEKYRLDITPVLFFEYPSIREIAQFLAQEHQVEVLRIHSVSAGSASGGGAVPAAWPEVQTTSMESSREISLAINKGWNPEATDGSLGNQPLRQGVSPEHRFIEKPVAIVGMSGVMPQSEDLEEFWENLKNARNLVTLIPKDRWNWEDYDGDPLKEENKSNSKWGGFMKEVDKFDPLFFGISPKEAELMDPQQRIFLETVCKAIEDSGHKVSDLAGTKTGLFVGVATNDYREWLLDVPVHAYASTGNSHSVLANRVSFLLDLHGPSAPLDTACSSSLIALHRALESIHTGSSDMAIVGGVQVMLAVSGYIAFSQAGMLASDGKCKTFDKRANGYVRGEGSGAIFLKPLSMAQADGDHIYALVKSTAENHGGSAAALTAPNPNAQSELLIEAYSKAQIDPTTVGYIECHGTGTSLGDPIEIKALKKAFSALYQQHDKVPAQTPHCGLSSVKTNIGHLETAAGIAGILKALLAIKHRQIPALIHFEEINPYIDLKGSPFYIADKTTPWAAPRAEDGTILPRRAGVSSFGFGGANAHIVLEEYLTPADRHPIATQGPQLIVLSAKNRDRLKAYAHSMLAHLDKHPVNLAGFAYTLQVGRDEMPERLALVASDTEELQQKFKAFLHSTGEVESLYQGNVRSGKKSIQAAPEEQVDETLISSLIAQKNLAKLAEFWVSGGKVDWPLLHPGGIPERISLPTYPFARERYWVAARAGKNLREKGPSAQGPAGPTRLHALIHRNASTLKEQKFASRFTGEEFYFADHIVETQKILPGVAYMEMARVAGELSAEAPVRFIRNLVWMRPLTIENDPRDVELLLVPNQHEVEFTVRTIGKEHSITNCSGRLAYSGGMSEPAALDLAGIQRRCTEAVISGRDLYPRLNNMGLKLGRSFQIVQKIYASEAESLAILQLPEHLKKEANQFWLHPALMDGSLHTAVGLMLAGRMEVPLALPYSVGEVQILRPLTDLYYGYATWADDAVQDEQGLLKVNIQLLDKEGNVLVRIKEFLSRPLLSQTTDEEVIKTIQKQGPDHSEDSAATTKYYQSIWKESAFPDYGDKPLSLGDILIFDRQESVRNTLKERLAKLTPEVPRIILVKPGSVYSEKAHNIYEINPERPEDYQSLFASLLKREFLPENVLHLWAEKQFSTDKKSLQASLDEGVFSLFYLSQALMQALKEHRKTPKQSKTKLLYIYSSDRQRSLPQHAAISGLARSIAAENSRFIYKTVEFQNQTPPAIPTPAEVVDSVISELQDTYAADVEVRYRARSRWVKQIENVELAPSTESYLKEKGVYLITGGAGGLGLIFANYLARQTGARLALTGRSALAPEQKEKIRELEASGAEVEYFEADVSRCEDVETLIAKVKSRFNGLDGIIHSAGIVRDATILNKTAEEMEAVFAAKIHGTVNLDEATKEENLDFLVLFSSVTAITGNAGQSDYAYANSFMDHFAELRNQLREDQERSGKTLSFNWPLWREGGMQIDEQMQAVFEKTVGFRALATEIGLDTFTKGLTNNQNQILVMDGNQQKIRKVLGIPQKDSQEELMKGDQGIIAGQPARARPVATSTIVDVPMDQNAIEQELLTVLKKDLFQMVNSTLGIKEEMFSHDVDMIEYGLDSISLSKFFSDINERYTVDLTPAVFFEYPTFTALSQFLCEEYKGRLTQYFKESLMKFQPQAETAIQAAPPFAAEIAHKETVSVQSRFGNPSSIALISDISGVSNLPSISPAIAVIGMGAVMPRSDNVDIFWKNLVAEQDLITEIPPNRWDWRDFQGDPVKGKNKTNSKWGGFMNEVDKFDAFFFGISPLEAELMDPQQRIFLETVWKTIEDAGHSPADLAGTKTSIFVGVGGHDYLGVLRDSNIDVVAYASTGNTHSVLANRISYLLDLRGTSEPVDTACSASLVAIHRAVEAISSGSCEMAIAGGVNVILRPDLYLAFGNAGMLASDGKCKTFDKRADGYVRGEGVGAIFLKKLDQAVSDGNHIYGIIKGSGVNHGGHATALTAPNPNAQAELIIGIYEKAEIDPDTVSYIEAHGTGTALGDPVEINGLKKAFKELNKRKGPEQAQRAETEQAYCGVGSVKTNIGHLETAAGIAGVIKVLLSMKHKKIPGNIHFEETNPHIRLEGSPFYIVQKTRDWNPLKDRYGQDIPRRAGVSSFGFGGANAHIILEEYIPAARTGKPAPVMDPQGNLVILLSARTEEQLQQKANDLLNFISGPEQTTAIDLTALAYTLQVGREAMEERLGFMVGSVDRLAEKLQAYVNGEQNIEGAYQGQIKRNKEGMSIISQDDDIKETIIEKLTAGKKLSKLLDLWVKGLEVDWNKLYGDVKPQRLSLPTYPFARQRYWVAKVNTAQATPRLSTSGAATAVLHPLLHSNTSDLCQQSYSAVFNGEEFFLKDHRVNTNGRRDMGTPGQKMLPAVVYLEMARVAVEKASPARPESTILALHNIDWLEPVFVAEDKEVTIALFENGSDDNPFEQIDYEIYSTEAEQETIHCQGQVVFIRKPALAKFDIPRLKAQMQQGSLDITSLYSAFARIGIDYGTALQGLSAIYRGDNQLLARLNLPAAIENRLHEYCLHPSLMDSVLHACMALLTDLDQLPDRPSRPIALESLTVVSACTEEMFAWVRYSGGSQPVVKDPRLDIDLMDSQGNGCVLMRGLLLEHSEGNNPITELTPDNELTNDTPEISMLAPKWDVVSLFAEPSPQGGDHCALLIGANERERGLFEKIYGQANIINSNISAKDSVDDITQKIKGLVFDRVIWIAPDNPVKNLVEESIIEGQNRGVIQIFRIIKSLVASGHEEKNIEWNLMTFNSQMVNPTDRVNPTHASLQGFSGSMANEYPQWKIRLLDLQELSERPVRDLRKLPHGKHGAFYAFRNSEWFSQKLISVKNLSQGEVSYRSQGVYIVIGGSGGLGEVWSQYVIEQYQAQVVWIGRREVDNEIQQKINRLEKSGKKPEYIQADASNLKELQAAYRKIKKKYSSIHGVVHSAVGIFDESLKTVKEEHFKTILSVKIDVSVRLAQVFQKETLDFVLFFSSGASFARSGGMSGYSAGCTFKDTFALQLSKLWACNVKVINWGYWAVGTGDTISDYMKAVVHQSGQRAIEPDEGMQVLERFLASNVNQIAVIKTLPRNKTDLAAANEWIVSYNNSLPTARFNKDLAGIEAQALPLAFKGASETDNKDMEELLYELLNHTVSSTTDTIDFYGRWLQESKNILAAKGFPGTAKDREQVEPSTAADLWAKWDKAKENWLQEEKKRAVCILVEKCMRALPDILTGKQKATDVIFPGSSLELVEGFYTSPVSQAYNEILTDTLISALQLRLRAAPSAQLRILEVGAGTGATTAGIIERLQPFQHHIAEYCYTDLSKAFLFHAENVYAPKAPYLRTRIFNIEKPIAEQNIAADRYDFVIAANVLHATKNIRNTLRNTKAVLRHTGMLLLNEVSDRSLYAHLIFGLLEGWWLNEDNEIRVPGSPALYPETWKAVLEEEGFSPVLFPAKDVHKFGQQIVLAVSDGIVRQTQETNAGKTSRQLNANLSKIPAHTQLEVEV